jgi:hypothetical protein
MKDTIVKILTDERDSARAELAEWRGLYEHGLEDRNSLLASIRTLEVELLHSRALVVHRSAVLDRVEGRVSALETLLQEVFAWNDSASYIKWDIKRKELLPQSTSGAGGQ